MPKTGDRTSLPTYRPTDHPAQALPTHAKDVLARLYHGIKPIENRRAQTRLNLVEIMRTIVEQGKQQTRVPL